MTPQVPTTRAGYAGSAIGAPARSRIPSTPTPSAASAMVNQNRIGPRRRGLRGRGRYVVATGTGVPGAGVRAPVVGSGTCGTGGALGRGLRSRSRKIRTSRATSATSASGHGKPNCPMESPRTSSAEIAPTTTRAMDRLRSSRLSGALAEPSSGSSSQHAPYSSSPAPPKKTSTTKATRRMMGSMSRWRARPPATPATLRSAPVVRRILPRSRISSRVAREPWGLWSEPSSPWSAEGGPVGASGGVVVMASTLRPLHAHHHRGRP